MGDPAPDTPADPSATRAAPDFGVRAEWALVGLLAIVVAALGIATASGTPAVSPFAVERVSPTPDGSAPPYHLVVNVNTASWQRLSLVPGIGKTRAQAIVALREERGRIREIDELEAIHRVGPNLIDQWRPHLTVGPPRDAPDPAPAADTGDSGSP